MPTTDPTSWPALLFQYGPFAIMVFLLVYAIAVAHRNRVWAKDSGDRIDRRLSQTIYGVVWLLFFGCTIFAGVVWMRFNLPDLDLIKGDLETVGQVECKFSSPNVYIPATVSGAPMRQNWWYIGTGSPGAKVTLDISRQKGGSQADYFSVVLKRDYFRRELRIVCGDDLLFYVDEKKISDAVQNLAKVGV
jgi:hypothetical protein